VTSFGLIRTTGGGGEYLREERDTHSEVISVKCSITGEMGGEGKRRRKEEEKGGREGRRRREDMR
jgi:hypothetical protein